jgi:TRAP-type C4-dicarboxylate transport system permease small subunit
MANSATPDLPPATAGGTPHGMVDAEGIGPPTGLLGEYPALQRVERWLSLAPAAILFAMMAITFANVFLRYLFRAPMSGALEILSYLMGLLVFLSLPLVTARGEHVRVSLLDTSLPGWLRRVRGVVFNLVLGVASAMLGWRMWLFGERLMSWGDKTQQYGLSLGGLAALFAVSCGVMALIFVLTAVKAALSRDFVNRMDI